MTTRKRKLFSLENSTPKKISKSAVQTSILSPSVTNRGCTLDMELTCLYMRLEYVNQQTITYIVSLDICKLLVHTLVRVRLDYGNAMLCGARDSVIRQLERVQREAARVVCKKIKYDMHTSMTELLWDYTGCRSVYVSSTKYYCWSTRHLLRAHHRVFLTCWHQRNK